MNIHRISRLQKETNSRSYKIIMLEELFPPYFDEGDVYHKSRGIWKWKKKQIFSYQYRSYRNWKYNRKTKWKDKVSEIF
jgi:hypothetical protein